ncbi:hypothetical protein J23TS9_35480 [Paenibacillus sp. J23TS9]|uniref:hypothetical protein n=1 Tax=Paenibacillus sp. J23TS9 TaxID=2807193 RepID=UPI001B179268|nr:hypothetical protein [Paenibacillus sp. J23TS9]GIP28418.1 hypothetical protein J23TS9_35480 [Paenibacillus sp. J23TS9]
MNKKKPVRLRPYYKTRYTYEKLRVCKHCRSFTVLWEDKCASCGKHMLIPVMEQARINAKRSMQSERLIALLITLAAVLFSQTFLQIILCLLGGIALTALLWWFQRKMLETETKRQLDKLLRSSERRIIEGIYLNLTTASAAIKDDEQLGYEILREIATIVHNDRIRLQQIMLLQTFVLRKDMELELDPLMLDGFEPALAEYIGELAKIKRELVKNRAIRYVLLHEREILRMKNGAGIMTTVAGAAVRMKKYVDSYPDFILRYARQLPQERFLRLYQLVRRNPNQSWNGLRDEVSAIYNEKYRWDPEFQKWE